jgi:hypothetical protein
MGAIREPAPGRKVAGAELTVPEQRGGFQPVKFTKFTTCRDFPVLGFGVGFPPKTE